MEEDIKILEEMLNSKEPVCNYILKHQEIEAISNLLTRYKQLEEKLDNSRKANELLNKTNNELRWGKRTAYSKAVNDIISKFNLGDEYIPKSKIKEKKKEKEESFKKTCELHDCDTKFEALNKLQYEIDLCEELLEEE